MVKGDLTGCVAYMELSFAIFFLLEKHALTGEEDGKFCIPAMPIFGCMSECMRECSSIPYID